METIRRARAFHLNNLTLKKYSKHLKEKINMCKHCNGYSTNSKTELEFLLELYPLLQKCQIKIRRDDATGNTNSV